MGGRQQCRGCLPTCQRRITILRPLRPVIPAMLVQQLIGERENHAKAKRLRPRRKVPMPCRARRIERPARQADIQPASQRLQPEIMAHPHIMVDVPTIAVRQHLQPQTPPYMVESNLKYSRESTRAQVYQYVTIKATTTTKKK